MTKTLPVSYLVRVDEDRDERLAGSGPLRYVSPPQSEHQARLLAALLNGRHVTGPGPWQHPIAGGRRTIHLDPVPQP